MSVQRVGAHLTLIHLRREFKACLSKSVCVQLEWSCAKDSRRFQIVDATNNGCRLKDNTADCVSVRAFRSLKPNSQWLRQYSFQQEITIHAYALQPLEQVGLGNIGTR